MLWILAIGMVASYLLAVAFWRTALWARALPMVASLGIGLYVSIAIWRRPDVAGIVEGTAIFVFAGAGVTCLAWVQDRYS